MDTMLWFKMLLFLLVIGTMTSLIAGTPIPGSPTSTAPIGNNLTFGLKAINQSTTSCYNVTPCFNPWGCPPVCSTTGTSTEWFGIPAFIGWVVGSITGAITFGVAVFGFFTGISAAVTGGLAIPAPFDFLFGIVIIFMWLFVVIEPIRAIVGIIWGT
jgi:hypothetical protein